MIIDKDRLKKNLEEALSLSIGEGITIKSIDDEILEATSRSFDIARLNVKYNNKGSSKEEELKMILKRLKPNSPKTDFSNKKTSIHREITELSDYTRRLFEYIQSPSQNGSYKGLLVKFYGQVENEIYEEDAGDVSLETLFIEKTPRTKLLKELIERISEEHNKWSLHAAINTMKYKDIGDIRVEDNFREKSHDNLEVILKFFEKDNLNEDEENIINRFFWGLDSYLEDSKFSILRRRLIHADLHPGHVFLKYDNKDLKEVLKMSKTEINNAQPKIKIVDITGMSIGPQTFDLVDIIKHPVSINANEYYTQEKQEEFIENLLELYIHERLKELREESIFKGDFITLFYVSDIYRSIRAVSKGILLKLKHVELHKRYLAQNPKYDNYKNWYLANLGEDLRYLIMNEKFENFLPPPLNQKIIHDFYILLRDRIEDLKKDPIEISRQIIDYDK